MDMEKFVNDVKNKADKLTPEEIEYWRKQYEEEPNYSSRFIVCSILNEENQDE